MVDRTLPTSASPDITGADYMDAVSGSVADLFNKSAAMLTSIAGTADAITATIAPDFDAGLVAGMTFFLTAGATNTGAVTLAINSEAAEAVKNPDGSALTAGLVVSGTTYVLMFDGTDFRILGSSTLTKINHYQAFTASGTWTKPANCPDDAIVEVELWGAGGGGGESGLTARKSGGGGGSYVFIRLRAGDLASTVTVTVGAGGVKVSNGVSGTAGGNSSFGSHAIAYGGGGGYSTSSGNGYGGGGAATTAAGNTSAGVVAPQVGLGYGHHGGAGGDLDVTGAENSVEGGGGGGSHGVTTPTAAGSSYYGGGGGQSIGNPGTNKGAVGTSVRGGNGGLAEANGSAPGGGGGGGGNGARGEVRVWTRG